jgi:hypothetical protein
MIVNGSTHGFAMAWDHTRLFWWQTILAVSAHPFAVLFCAAVPAAERGYTLLQKNPIPRSRLVLLEATVTLWRIFLCWVAVRVALSRPEWLHLREQAASNAGWQLGMQRIGIHLSSHLHVVLWEIILFFAAFLLLNAIFGWLLRLAAAAGLRWLKVPQHKKAAASVLRNLILAPLAVIYLVELLRPAFQ